MYYVYVIKCSNHTLYVGYSNDLKKRIERHRNKEVKSTQYRTPVKLIYYESFLSKKDAKSREIYLKSGAGREQLRKILKNTLRI